jgi:hypothetical protein
MTMRSIGLHVLAIAAGVFLAASPAMGQSCPKQAATGHVEFIGTMPANLGRHIIYSFSAIQTGAVDENEECVVNGEGANDPPDEGSALRGVTRANAFLHRTAGLPRPTAPTIRGNVQVQP